jgi:hypothetical protein
MTGTLSRAMSSTAGAAQPVRRDREIAGQRRAAGHVLDVRVEAAVLVDDDDRGRPFRGFRTRPVDPDLPTRSRVARAPGREPRIRLLDLPAVRVVGLEQRQHRRRSGAAAGDLRQPRDELPPRQAGVHVLVVEIGNATIDAHGSPILTRRSGRRSVSAARSIARCPA